MLFLVWLLWISVDVTKSPRLPPALYCDPAIAAKASQPNPGTSNEQLSDIARRKSVHTRNLKHGAFTFMDKRDYESISVFSHPLP